MPVISLQLKGLIGGQGLNHRYCGWGRDSQSLGGLTHFHYSQVSPQRGRIEPEPGNSTQCCGLGGRLEEGLVQDSMGKHHLSPHGVQTPLSIQP